MSPIHNICQLECRESASIYISQILHNSGANITIYDPKVSEEVIINDIEKYWTDKIIYKKIKSRIKILKKLKNDFRHYDAVAILTEWDEFKRLNLNDCRVYDGRNILEDSYYSIGKFNI